MFVPVSLLLPLLAPALAPVDRAHADDEAPAEAAEDNVLRIYDVSSLRFDEVDHGMAERGIRLTPLRYGDIHDPEDLYEEDASGSESMVDLLLDLFGAEFEYEGRRVSITSDGRLAVRGPEGLHQRVSEMIVFLEETLNAQVELGIDVLSLPEGVASTVASLLTPEEGDQLVEAARSGGDVESFRLAARADRIAMLDLAVDMPVLADYDVEIAQGAAIHDPIVFVLSSGTRAYLRGAPGRGGTHLALTMQRGEPLATREIDAKLRFFAGKEQDGISIQDSVGSLSVIDVLGACSAFTTFLPDEGVLAMRTKIATSRGELDEVVLIRRTGGGLPLRSELELSPGGARLVLADLGGLAPPRAAAASKYFSPEFRPTQLASSVSEGPPLVAYLRPGDSDFVDDLIDGSQDYTGLDMLGPWLVSRPYGRPAEEGDGRARAEQDATLAAFDELTPTAELLELTVTGRRAGAVPVQARLPIQAGTSATFALGVEGPEVIDYDVEVAQFASVGDPVIKLQFEGLMLWVRATPTVGGGLALDLRGGLRVLQSQGRIELDSPLLSDLQQSRFQHLFLDERRVLTARDGVWSMVLGDPGRRGRSEGLALEVSVRRR